MVQKAKYGHLQLVSGDHMLFIFPQVSYLLKFFWNLQQASPSKGLLCRKLLRYLGSCHVNESREVPFIIAQTASSTFQEMLGNCEKIQRIEIHDVWSFHLADSECFSQQPTTQMENDVGAKI